MRIVVSVLALAVALTIVGKLSAADDKACPATEPQHHAMGMPWDILKGLNLTDDQKAKVKELHKEIHEKLMAILTPEQKEQLKQKCEKDKACK